MIDRIRPSTILSIIHAITIGTKLNNNGGNTGHGLENVMRKQTIISGFFQFYKIWILKFFSSSREKTKTLMKVGHRTSTEVLIHQGETVVQPIKIILVICSII